MTAEFAAAFSLVFLAEMGDKSMLLALTFASRYRPAPVFAGIVIAALVSTGIATLAGAALGAALPARALALGSGAVFLVFAVLMLRGGPDDDDDGARLRSRSVFVGVTLAFLVAELGDKTTLATAMLATTQSPVPTWLGASLGMSSASALAIVVGYSLGRRLPRRVMRIIAAAAFGVAGLVLLVGAW